MNIKLCKWSLENQDELVKICNLVNRNFLANRLPDPYTLEDATWWINMICNQKTKHGVFRAIVVDGKIVGNISVEQKSDVYFQDAEIGFLLNTDKWSKGVMTRAVEQICEIAFLELNIIRITGSIYEPNMASRRVLEKNNFVLEGILKNAINKNGRIFNLCIYGKQL